MKIEDNTIQIISIDCRVFIIDQIKEMIEFLIAEGFNVTFEDKKIVAIK